MNRLLAACLLLVLALPVSAASVTDSRPLNKQTLKELQRTVRNDPLNLRAYAYLGAHYLGVREAPTNEFIDSINLELQTSGAFYEDALRRREQGEYRAAVIQLLNAIESDEDNLSAYILMAEVHGDLRLPEGQELYLRRARDRGADPALVVVPLAEAMLYNGNYQAVLDEISPVSQSPELRARILVMHGRAHLGLRSYDEAEALLQQALEVAPGLDVAELELARLNVFRGSLDTATDFLAASRTSGEFLPDWWVLQGEVALARGETEAADGHFRAALALEEDHILALNALGNMHLRLQDYAAARTFIESFRQFYPEDLRALLLLLLLETAEGNDIARDEAAIVAGGIIDQLDYNRLEDDAYGLLIVGHIHHLSGRMTEAVSFLDRYVTEVPQDINAIRLLVSAYLTQEQTEQAVRLVEGVSGSVTEEPGWWALAAETYISHGDFATALPFLDRLIALSDDNLMLRERRARLMANLGDYDGAVALLTELVDASADLQVATTLVNLWLATGDYGAVLALTDRKELFASEMDRLNVRGKALLGLGNLDEAQLTFESVLDLDRTFVDARFNIGVINRRRGNLDLSAQQLNRVLRESPGHRLAMLHLASIAEEQDRSHAAVRLLEQAIAERPDVETQVRRIILLQKSGREQEARSAMTSLRVQFPESLVVLEAEAEMNLRSDNVARAQQVYMTMRDLAREQESVQALVRIAASQLDIGDISGAEGSLVAAERLSPNASPVLLARARFATAQGDFETALEAATTLVAQDSASPAAYSALGDAYRNLGKPEEAIAAYRRGIGETTGSLQLVVGYYLMLREQSGPGDAVTFLADYIRDNEVTNYSMLRLLAAGYADAGDSVRALEINEALRVAQPEDPVVLNNLAMLYFEAGRDDALALAQQAYELAPENPSVMDTLGWILVNQGDAATGVSMLRNALARASNQPEVRYHYAVGLYRNGQTQQARQELQALLASGEEFSDREEARSLFESLR